MSVDVACEIEIPQPPERIARWMFDPKSDPLWMKAVERVEVEQSGHALGARVRRFGRFLGKTISWTSEVAAYTPDRHLKLILSGGPFTGEVNYEIEPKGKLTRVRIRNTGESQMFTWMPEFLTSMAMRAAMKSDLKRLAELAQRPLRMGH